MKKKVGNYTIRPGRPTYLFLKEIKVVLNGITLLLFTAWREYLGTYVMITVNLLNVKQINTSLFVNYNLSKNKVTSLINGIHIIHCSQPDNKAYLLQSLKLPQLILKARVVSFICFPRGNLDVVTCEEQGGIWASN